MANLGNLLTTSTDTIVSCLQQWHRRASKHEYSMIASENGSEAKSTLSVMPLAEESVECNAKESSSYMKILALVALLFPRSLRPVRNRKPGELQSTAWLDALRGYVAWIVYTGHVIHEDWRPETSFLMQFPCFKIFFRGHGMVDIFFGISGYALSYRVMGYIHAKQSGKVLDSLASSAFRRYPRLYLPMVFATFVAMVAISTGLAVKGEDPQVLQETMLGNLRYWIKDVVRASDPFPHVVTWWYGGTFGTNYLPQMWTIPVEFRGSMTLFIFCAATCKMTWRARGLITWLSIGACLWWQSAYAALFLMGMWLADCQQRKLQRQLRLLATSTILPTQSLSPTSSSMAVGNGESGAEMLHAQAPGSHSGSVAPLDIPKTFAEPTLLQQVPYFIMFTASLYPLTAPLLISTDSRFPYNFIAYFMPATYGQGAQIHWPLSIGAMMLLYSIDRSPILQRPLTASVSQFIGELSFGIYAMHQTIRWIVWERFLIRWQAEFFMSDAKDFWKLLPGYLVMSLMVIWAAEGFRRADVRIVRFSRYLQERCFE